MIKVSGDLRMRIESKERACLMIDASKGGKIALSLEKNASAQIFLLSKSIDKIEQSVMADLGANAELKIYELGWSLQDLQRTIAVDLVGEGAKVAYHGIDHLYKDAKKKTLLTIRHAGEATKSEQLFRGVYSDAAYGHFLGKVIIDKNAKKSQALQGYKSLIASVGAKAHVMPQLEIYNDDISASHGASIGQVDEESLFYLCSRGLSLSSAKSLLVRCFLQEVLEPLEQLEIKGLLIDELMGSIDRAAAS